MRALVFLLPVFSLPLACATSVGETAQSQTTDLTSYCNARAEAECSPKVVSGCGVKDATACSQKRSAICVAAAPQGATFQPTQAASCVDTVKTAYADATFDKTKLATIDTACAVVWSGPGAARAPCTVDLDCSSADGLACIIPMGQTSGKCLKPNVVANGGACPGEADVCSDGFYCDSKSQVCLVEGGLGSMCLPDTMPCSAEFACQHSIFSSGCIAKKADGAACTTDDECTGGLCDKAQATQDGNCATTISLTPLDSMCVDYK